jgi:hypothetical protein
VLLNSRRVIFRPLPLRCRPSPRRDARGVPHEAAPVRQVCLGATPSRLAQLFWLRVHGVVRHFSPSAPALPSFPAPRRAGHPLMLGCESCCRAPTSDTHRCTPGNEPLFATVKATSAPAFKTPRLARRRCCPAFPTTSGVPIRHCPGGGAGADRAGNALMMRPLKRAGGLAAPGFFFARGEALARSGWHCRWRAEAVVPPAGGRGPSEVGPQSPRSISRGLFLSPRGGSV